MVQGTPAYCLPRQISFNAPISSARAALAGHCLLFRPLAEKSPQRIFALCRVAAAKLGRVLNASRPDATNRPDGRTPFGAADARVTALDRPWSDASRVYSAWSQPGSDPSGGGACESPHSTRGVAIQTTDMMRHSFVLHGSGMMHDSSDGVSNNILLHHAPRFRHAVAQP